MCRSVYYQLGLGVTTSADGGSLKLAGVQKRVETMLTVGKPVPQFRVVRERTAGGVPEEARQDERGRARSCSETCKVTAEALDRKPGSLGNDLCL